MTEFVRTHPMEGRGCRSNFFQFLLRCGSAKTSPEVRIPDTVVFEHGYPRWWYAYDGKTQEVRRMAGGKDLHAKNLHTFFVENAPRAHGKAIDVIAAYTYLFDDPKTDETLVRVEYHDAASLDAFLHAPSDPRKKDGVLQLLVLPLEEHYTVTSAAWCPAVSIVRRRSSLRTVTDHRATARQRFVTFDGSEYYSTSVNVADDTKGRIVACCQRVADHLRRGHGLHVASMQLFFLVDRTGHPTLLWCGSLFFGKNAAESVPASLMWTSVFADDEKERHDRAITTELRAARQTERAVARSMRGGADAGSGSATRGDAAADKADGDGGARGGGGGGAGAGGGVPPLAPQILAWESTLADTIDGELSRWHEVSEEVSGLHEAVCAAERTAHQHLHDIFYTAQSHFQQERATALNVELPFELSRCLGGPEDVARLMLSLGLETVDGGQAVRFPPPAERVANAVGCHPLPKIAHDAEAWVGRHFDEQRRVVRQEHMAAVLNATAKACARMYVAAPDSAVVA